MKKRQDSDSGSEFKKQTNGELALSLIHRLSAITGEKYSIAWVDLGYVGPGERTNYCVLFAGKLDVGDAPVVVTVQRSVARLATYLGGMIDRAAADAKTAAGNTGGSSTGASANVDDGDGDDWGAQ